MRIFDKIEGREGGSQCQIEIVYVLLGVEEGNGRAFVKRLNKHKSLFMFIMPVHFLDN